jgi:hypothetical protein
MKKKISLLDEILNTLADDGENIVQIEIQLGHFQIPYTREQIKSCIDEMLDKDMVCIEYPYRATVNEFKSLMWDDNCVEDYWFRMTDKGRKYWEDVEFEEDVD